MYVEAVALDVLGARSDAFVSFGMGKTMRRAGLLTRGWVGLLLLASMTLHSGCATVAQRTADGAAPAFGPAPSHSALRSSARAVSLGDDFSSWEEPGGESPLRRRVSAHTQGASIVQPQRGVDMLRWVESLDDWSAVRLGALGPLHADAAEVLNRKRASFLVSATESYGLARAEVFALFILHSAFDDDLRRVLELLARDKQLGGTLGRMSVAREELRRRGMPLPAFPERAERGGDVLRGLGRAARDALSSTAVSDGARYVDLSAKRGQLPPPYQDALDEVERALMEQHYAPGSVALGSFDHLTFGVPLGFFHLAVGTSQGASSLARGRYEQATRELAPAALMVALYAGGKGLRAVSEATGTAPAGVNRLPIRALSLEELKAVADRLAEQLGSNGLRELARYIQASREAALLVCEGGEPAAAALHEARGDVARAQAVLSKAHPERAGPLSMGAGADTPVRNSHLAGRTHPVTGVPFDADGYPDFRAANVVKAEVKIEYTGSRDKDYAAANKAAGLKETPSGMTWHHHQDRTTMQLVPVGIHAKTGHTGGFSGGK